MHNLIDSEAKHRADPDRWDYPLALINRIRPGAFAKICAQFDHAAPTEPNYPNAERFWCRVLQVSASGIQVKVTQSDMLCSDHHNVHDGDMLTIERRHILDVAL